MHQQIFLCNIISGAGGGFTIIAYVHVGHCQFRIEIHVACLGYEGFHIFNEESIGMFGAGFFF